MINEIPRLQVEEFIGTEHIDVAKSGVFTTIEAFMIDNINRLVVQIYNSKNKDKLKNLLDLNYKQAINSPHFGDKKPLELFNSFTKTAWKECYDAQHFIAAFSLLRLSRNEQIKLTLIQRREPFLIDDAKKIIDDYADPGLEIATFLGAEITPDTARKLFQLSAKKTLREAVPFEPDSVEYLNVPYLVQDKLLLTAQVIIAKCRAMQKLNWLILNKDESDYEYIAEKTKTYRYKFLEWQYVQLLLL